MTTTFVVPVGYRLGLAHAWSRLLCARRSQCVRRRPRRALAAARPDSDDEEPRPELDLEELQRAMDESLPEDRRVDLAALAARLSPRYAPGTAEPETPPKLPMMGFYPTREQANKWPQDPADVERYVRTLTNPRRVRRPIKFAFLGFLAYIAYKALSTLKRNFTFDRYGQVVRSALAMDFYSGFVVYLAVPAVLFIWSCCVEPTRTDSYRRIMMSFALSLTLFPFPYALLFQGGGGIPLGSAVLALARFVSARAVWHWKNLQLEMALHDSLAIHRAINFWKYPLAWFSTFGVAAYSVAAASGFFLNRPGLVRWTDPVVGVVVANVKGLHAKLPPRLVAALTSHLVSYLVILCTVVYLAQLIAWFSYTIDLGREQSGRNDRTYIERRLVELGFFLPGNTDEHYSDLVDYVDTHPYYASEDMGFVEAPHAENLEDMHLMQLMKREEVRLKGKRLAFRSEALERSGIPKRERLIKNLENWNKPGDPDFDVSNFDLFHYDDQVMDVDDLGSIVRRDDADVDWDGDVDDFVADIRNNGTDAQPDLAVPLLGRRVDETAPEDSSFEESWQSDESKIFEQLARAADKDMRDNDMVVDYSEIGDLADTQSVVMEDGTLKATDESEIVGDDSEGRDSGDLRGNHNAQVIDPESSFEDIWNRAVGKLSEPGSDLDEPAAGEDT